MHTLRYLHIHTDIDVFVLIAILMFMIENLSPTSRTINRSVGDGGESAYQMITQRINPAKH